MEILIDVLRFVINDIDPFTWIFFMLFNRWFFSLWFYLIVRRLHHIFIWNRRNKQRIHRISFRTRVQNNFFIEIKRIIGNFLSTFSFFRSIIHTLFGYGLKWSVNKFDKFKFYMIFILIIDRCWDCVFARWVRWFDWCDLL